ncbi:hypothetical protein WN55_04531 [Dufourea novaeangliae]|uniref:Uncharacterized protein n=1 Tax=Dufourea novaeangliae TaxID=178035 RepID=A0A154P155_DUFNO|nr:hypothetical protein WN55_04531 [Dufourea novaeangliae]
MPPRIAPSPSDLVAATVLPSDRVGFTKRARILRRFSAKRALELEGSFDSFDPPPEKVRTKDKERERERERKRLSLAYTYGCRLETFFATGGEQTTRRRSFFNLDERRSRGWSVTSSATTLGPVADLTNT